MEYVPRDLRVADAPALAARYLPTFRETHGGGPRVPRWPGVVGPRGADRAWPPAGAIKTFAADERGAVAVAERPRYRP